jgi:hypothetical protein
VKEVEEVKELQESEAIEAIEEIEEIEEKKVRAFDRKSPPFAKGAKDGAPSSSSLGRRKRNPRAQPGMAVPHGEKQEWPVVETGHFCFRE